jgi:hypothetical protein
MKDRATIRIGHHSPGRGDLGGDAGGRFSLGVGSGENLNEHIFGDRWPPTGVRLEMLEEAVEVMRLRHPRSWSPASG